MKKCRKIGFLFCGLLLMLVAVPLFAQDGNQAGKIEINKRPLDDLAKEIRRKVAAKEVDLGNSFSIKLQGVLKKDGKLDPKTANFAKSEGDAAMIEIGKGFIEAVNASGFFTYLSQLGTEKIDFTLAQDDNQTYAVIISELSTAQRAMTAASGLNSLIKLASFSAKNDTKKLNDETRILIDGMTVNGEDKKLIIKMAYEKSFVQEMINRKLKESEKK